MPPKVLKWGEVSLGGHNLDSVLSACQPLMMRMTVGDKEEEESERMRRKEGVTQVKHLKPLVLC